MSVAKNGVPIGSLDEWFRLGGPKRAYQWAEGRSAMEVARAWLEVRSPSMPAEIEALLRTHPDFGACSGWSAEPEARVPFDEFRGEPRNTDLLVNAQDEFGPYLLAVEAKADETCGELVSEALVAAGERLKRRATSNGVRRIERLASVLFGIASDQLDSLGHLRYQLLTATAGALAAARRVEVSRVVLLVHEFVTDRTDDRRHAANQADWERFVGRLAPAAVGDVRTGVLGGPHVMPGAFDSGSAVQLYFGKAVRRMRA